MTLKKRPQARIGRAVVDALESRRLLSLAAPVGYIVGDSPQGVATGDFNGDGRSDVVTANASSNTVSLLLSNANGTLQPAQNIAIGVRPQSVAVGDVNNDGKVDIMTANFGDYGNFGVIGGTVGVLLGNGNGTFQPATGVALPHQFPPDDARAIPRGQAPVSVAVGDINGDGKLDLAVNARASSAVFTCGYYSCGYQDWPVEYVNVLLGNGEGTFETASTYYQAYLSQSIGLADFNGDSKLDVVTATNGPVVRLGNGNGTLQTPIYSTGSGHAVEMVIGDFDSDGKQDLVTRGGSGLNILKGAGNGTFQVASTVAVLFPTDQVGIPGAGLIRSVVAGDVDADGKLDLVVHTQQTVYETCPYYCYNPSTTDQTKVLLGFGDGTFSLPISSTLRSYAGQGTGSNRTALADLNGDARPDVIATEPAADSVTVQLNQGGWIAPVAVQIGDATVTEGHVGTVNAVLTVSIDHAVPFSISVPFATSDGSATVAGGDYVATSGTLNFSPGQTSKTITVQVRGDRRGEEQETFFVDLGDATNGFVVDGRGIVTVLEDEPRLSINTTESVTEGNSGTKPLVLTATISAPYDAPVTFNYTTQGGGFATADVDFDAAPGTVTFQPGQTSRPITVTVRGDTVPEYAESLFVIPSGVSGALWDGTHGHAMIFDDDAGAAVVISNVARAEGHSGITPFIFTLTRLTPSERESYVYYSTSGGSASSGGGNKDYEPISSSSVVFSPGQVNSIIVVHVRGDTRSESDETFFVNLTDISDGSIADSQGVGTILNDESRGKTWIGPNTGGDWSNPANWSPSGVPTATSLVTIAGDWLTLSSSATVAELSLSGNAQLTIAPSGNRVLRTGALFIENLGGSDVGILDLSNNNLIVDYPGGAGNLSPLGAFNRTGFGIGGAGATGWYDGVLGALAQGRNHGDWSGAGIVTTRPDALAGLTTLGAGEASQVLGLAGSQTGLFAGQTVDATTILLRYTFAGDGNLDGAVTGDDYSAIDFASATPGAFGWSNGDFNYDGIISGDDYSIIDFNLIAQGDGKPLAGDAGAAGAAAPADDRGRYESIARGWESIEASGEDEPAWEIMRGL